MGRIESLALRHGFTAGLGLAAAGFFVLGLLLLWRSDGPAIPLPNQSPRSQLSARGPFRSPGDTAVHDARLRSYLKRLVSDARRFDVPFDGARFTSPFPFFVTEGPWKLSARGGRVTTRELRVRTQVKTLVTPLGGLGTYRTANLVLTVENRTDDYIAFRVDTKPSGLVACRPKAVLPQLTLVLGPREQLERTECLASTRDFLTVGRIDVLRIPALSYHYLLQLRPVSVGLPPRIAEGHTPPEGHTLCGAIPRQRIEQALRAGDARWIDVIDFYARYSCNHYDFRVGYRRPGEPPKTSPVERTLHLRKGSRKNKGSRKTK